MALRRAYSNALRSIGQALEELDIEAFDLKCADDVFHLQCGDPNPPYLTLMEREYSLRDIRSLEREGRAKRGRSFKRADFYGLAETLRALGQYLDTKGGYLVRVCNCDSSSANGTIILQYKTRNGDPQTEELSMSLIYQTSMRMRRERSPASGPISIFTRRSQ